MAVDFESWWLEQDYFPSGLDRMNHPLLKPYCKLYRSGLNPEGLTLIETWRLYFRAYLFMQDRMKSKRKPKTPDAQVLQKNERLFKRFGRIVADMLGANMENVINASAGVDAQVRRVPQGGSFGADNLLPRTRGLSQFVTQSMAQRNGIDQVIDRAFRGFQTVIELESGVAKGRAKDTWKSLIQEVIPMVPKLNGLLLKYYPDPSPLAGRTPEQWQTLILLAMVNYLEQKIHKPHYREAVAILNAETKTNDKLSYDSARARVTQFKNHHPDWQSDIEVLYTRQFTNIGADPVRLANPTC